ncbi:hypothetical protein DFJ43DRAFT_1072160 [Lentinula guzmanii]|uniref:Uncharacterized protein n=1 Tax=Lentinula guzmanii TaxID=2804957 RepID=A0AA38JCS7_9AGAR|nr:hypothetical protein DFJ43DRAFT_1072160 [Lentinula guzmanii]
MIGRIFLWTSLVRVVLEHWRAYDTRDWAFTKTGQHRRQQETPEYKPRGISDELDDWLNGDTEAQVHIEADWREELVDEGDEEDEIRNQNQ